MKYLKLNLQFFAEDNDNEDNTDNNNNTDNNADDSSNQLDVSALADIISEKDKQIEQLQKDVTELKKSNANLLVRVNSGGNSTQEKSFEENLLDMVGAKPRKEK